MQAYAPNGLEILGTYEMCPCRAEIAGDSWRKDAEGKIEFDWAGDTEMFYDGQEAVQHEGETVYLDVEGNEWRESQLILK